MAWYANESEPLISLEGRSILLLEDESLIVLDVMLALESSGALVLGRSNARDALELVAAEPIDAAVLDITLGDGETCEPVAERLAERDVPFLLQSGDAARHAELIARLGAPLVVKPFPSHRLAARLAHCIGMRERRRAEG